MTSPQIAVIITCYDLGRTVEEALQSVLDQTLPAAEVLIVDDGSRDLYTQQVLTRVERAGHKLLRTVNRGVSAARNTGIRSTRSPYLVLLDADDVLEATYLERAAAILEGNQALAFVSCGMTCFGAATATWYPGPPDLIESMVNGVVHVSSMFRREVWEAVGGFDESFRAHEEVDFWTRVLEHGFRGEVLAQPLLRYRIRTGSMYQSAIRRERHLDLMERFYRKHHATISTNAETLLAAKERFILDQQTHQTSLLARRAAIQAELEGLAREISEVIGELRPMNRDRVDFGDFRQTTPLSPFWGLDRGKPLDRHYIESFLDRHRLDIRGHVLEVKDPGYTQRFGDDRVTASDVLDVDPTNDRATIVADLTQASQMPANRFDCLILTQVLPLIYDLARH